MANDVSATRRRQDGEVSWNIVAILNITEEPDCDRWAGEQVTAVARSLQWPEANVTQLRQTLAQAVQNTRDRGNAGSIWVRLYVRRRSGAAGKSLPVRIRGPGVAPRGWSFFLVQKTAEDADPATGAHREMIELYLYEE